jgi:hypothetical protein
LADKEAYIVMLRLHRISSLVAYLFMYGTCVGGFREMLLTFLLKRDLLMLSLWGMVSEMWQAFRRHWLKFIVY